MSKISAIAKLEVKPEKADEFPAAWDVMFEHIKANEDGTEHYVLHRSTRDPNVFYMTEIYADQASADAHSSSPAMAAIGGSLGDFITNFDLDFCVPVKSAKSGL